LIWYRLSRIAEIKGIIGEKYKIKNYLNLSEYINSFILFVNPHQYTTEQKN
jgi:hypothetical protein